MVTHWGLDRLVRYGDTASKPGRLQAIIEHVDKVLRWHLTGRETRALIIADTETSPFVTQTMAGGFATFDVEPTVIVITQQDAPNLEPPDAVARAARATDVIVNVGTYALLHSSAMQRAITELDTTYLYLGGTNEDYFSRGAVEADPAKLDAFTRDLHERLRTADRVEVTCPYGTDVSFRIDGTRKHPFTGYPAGETPTCPVETSVEGTVVVDSYMMGVGLVDEPITWEITEGEVTAISGGQAARALQALLAEHGDEHARKIGEFSMMTNPCARPNGIYIEHLSVGGGTHFAIGDGTSLGGRYSSSIHLDGAQLNPTVRLDGETVIDQGEFTIG